MLIQGKGFIVKDIDVNEIDSILQVYKQCEDFLSLGPMPNASRQMVLDDLGLSKEEGDIFCGIYIDDEMIGVA